MALLLLQYSRKIYNAINNAQAIEYARQQEAKISSDDYILGNIDQWLDSGFTKP